MLGIIFSGSWSCATAMTEYAIRHIGAKWGSSQKHMENTTDITAS